MFGFIRLLHNCHYLVLGHRLQVAAYSGLAIPAHESFLTDLRSPAGWYTAAREIKRRVIAHVGPTNSGKTYQALNALKLAESGTYCGPLRLLAWEVADKLGSQGVLCNLLTGQEQRTVDGARHVSCTVEMASVTRVVQVGVIDEIQMMADPSRGWSFTRAILGLPCHELHVCGDPAALPLLQRLCWEAGDELEVREYERLAPLTVSKRALRSLDSVQKGDCVVAFSRKAVHELKKTIEGNGKHKCCMVYGALPPEARSTQALLFNTPRTGYNVLAASDAVGMGLNLNIRRIVFTSLSKFDGTSHRLMTVSEVKQIAGRAGRYRSQYNSGVVTCMDQSELPYLQAALQTPTDDLTSAALFPRFEQLALFGSIYPLGGLPSVLEAFAAQATLGAHYFLSDFTNVCALAHLTQHLPLSLQEAYTFAISPADANDYTVSSALVSFATAFCYNRRIDSSAIRHAPLVLPRTPNELQSLEATHRVYDLFIWLSYKFGKCFTGREAAQQMRSRCSALIQKALHELGVQRSRPSKVEREVLQAADVQLSSTVPVLRQQLLELPEWEERLYNVKQQRLRMRMRAPFSYSQDPPPTSVYHPTAEMVLPGATPSASRVKRLMKMLRRK